MFAQNSQWPGCSGWRRSARRRSARTPSRFFPPPARARDLQHLVAVVGRAVHEAHEHGAPVTWARGTAPGSSPAWRPRKGTWTARAWSLSSGGASIAIVTTSLARNTAAASTATWPAGHRSMFGPCRGAHRPEIEVREPPLGGWRGPARSFTTSADGGDREAAGVQHRHSAVLGAEWPVQGSLPCRGQRGLRCSRPRISTTRRSGLPLPQPLHVDRLAGGEPEPLPGHLLRRRRAQLVPEHQPQVRAITVLFPSWRRKSRSAPQRGIPCRPKANGGRARTGASCRESHIFFVAPPTFRAAVTHVRPATSPASTRGGRRGIVFTLAKIIQDQVHVTHSKPEPLFFADHQPAAGSANRGSTSPPLCIVRPRRT